MYCNNVQELFSDYIAGDLDPALTVTVENHLVTCGACRDVLAGMRQVWIDLDALPSVAPPALFHAGLMERIDAERAAGETRKSPARNLRALLRPQALALAATLLIFVLAGVEYVQTQRAALGPIGSVLHWLHPTAAPSPHLLAPRTQWIAGPGSSGALVVHLQSDSDEGRPGGALAYKVVLQRHAPDGSAAPDMSGAGTLVAGESRDIMMRMDTAPEPGVDTLSVSVTTSDGRPVETVTAPLPAVTPPAP